MNRAFFWIGCVTLIFTMLAGCSSDYTEKGVLKGTIIEVKEEIIKVSEDKKKENIFEIPVSPSNQYKIGQKVEVTIYSNTTTDVWDLKNMKFEVDILEE